jgi:putative tricarboxylic transport membrane protein
MKLRRFRLQNGVTIFLTIFAMLFFTGLVGKAAGSEADFPSKPIEYVCHLGPGASMDIFGRMIADILQKEKILSQPMVVVNKPGGGGAGARAYTFERKGNPHIVHGVASSTLLITPIVEKLPINYKSLTPLPTWFMMEHHGGRSKFSL